ncbi:hypothetical protein [Desulfatiglans anilini]|uniref:hypothetical protein n=1 Tax=Desulfatiglans anilini TaxID=90728 RepID=UPI0004085C0C|nr:hypothetical protein [Desulfatiglans anilini]
MFKRRIIITGIFALGIFLAGAASAHTPLCSCYDNGDGSITCEGGFSDGSSARGVQIRVIGKDGKLLFEGKMDEFSEFRFDKPAVPFSIEFDAGPGHQVTIEGEKL